MVGFEDYSLNLAYDEQRGYYEYVGCHNHSVIRRGSFVHLIECIGQRDFALLGAYRPDLSKEENILRNREIRKRLQGKSLRVYMLVCREQAETAVRRYLVLKPYTMPSDEFEQGIMDCLAVGPCRGEVALYCRQTSYCTLSSNGISVGSVPLLLDESQSHGISTERIVVVGVEEPVTNMGKMLYAMNGIDYPRFLPR